ncbi:hypothetical protein NLG97_g5685 [Lecanicillium saksenae]|uniref:Uncharacterized protein n=1 Tax=Lecanicillium saksenae TaxID=468837 RepID=A0ACC1QTG5_9HYPO|nr:hypothetical protein NLG97_g5685 [Lecanicillium saksenae]
MQHLGLVVRRRAEGGNSARAHHAVRRDRVGDGVGRHQEDAVAGLEAVVARQGARQGGRGVADLRVREAGARVHVDVLARREGIGPGASRRGRRSLKQPLPQGDVRRRWEMVWLFSWFVQNCESRGYLRVGGDVPWMSGYADLKSMACKIP